MWAWVKKVLGTATGLCTPDQAHQATLTPLAETSSSNQSLSTPLPLGYSSGQAGSISISATAQVCEGYRPVANWHPYAFLQYSSSLVASDYGWFASPIIMQSHPERQTCTCLVQDVPDKTPEDAGGPSTGRYIVSAKGLVRHFCAG
jgi:hypothetical protein